MKCTLSNSDCIIGVSNYAYGDYTWHECDVQGHCCMSGTLNCFATFVLRLPLLDALYIWPDTGAML